MCLLYALDRFQLGKRFFKLLFLSVFSRLEFVNLYFYACVYFASELFSAHFMPVVRVWYLYSSLLFFAQSSYAVFRVDTCHYHRNMTVLQTNLYHFACAVTCWYSTCCDNKLSLCTIVLVLVGIIKVCRYFKGCTMTLILKCSCKCGF